MSNIFSMPLPGGQYATSTIPGMAKLCRTDKKELTPMRRPVGSTYEVALLLRNHPTIASAPVHDGRSWMMGIIALCSVGPLSARTASWELALLARDHIESVFSGAHSIDQLPYADHVTPVIRLAAEEFPNPLAHCLAAKYATLDGRMAAARVHAATAREIRAFILDATASKPDVARPILHVIDRCLDSHLLSPRGELAPQELESSHATQPSGARIGLGSDTSRKTCVVGRRVPVVATHEHAAIEQE